MQSEKAAVFYDIRMVSTEQRVSQMDRFLRERSGEDPCEVKAFRPAMTISSQFGSGAELIDFHLVSYLNEVDDVEDRSWGYFDQGLIGRLIEDDRVEKKPIPFSEEKVKHKVPEVLRKNLNRRPTNYNLFNHTANTIRTLCSMGNVIIRGRAGNLITCDLANTFRIRLVGSERNRIDRVKENYGISKEDAEVLTREADSRREKYVRRFTGVAIGDPGYYHVVINTDDLDGSLLVRVVCDALLEWSHERKTPEQGLSPA